MWEILNQNVAEQTNVKFRLIRDRESDFQLLWGGAGALRAQPTSINIHCGLYGIISMAKLMQRAIYNNKYYMFIYLPGCHAVKTKHDIKALAHFTNIKTGSNFLHNLLAHGSFNDRLIGRLRMIGCKKTFSWLWKGWLLQPEFDGKHLNLAA